MERKREETRKWNVRGRSEKEGKVRRRQGRGRGCREEEKGKEGETEG